MSHIITQIDQLLQTQRDAIEEWLSQQRVEHPPFFYTSVDLRHSGFKIAVVDNNLFPAGFNNLSPAARGRTMRFMRDRLDAMAPPPQRVLIVPENHTRNLGYLENLHVLAELVEATGRSVQIGSLTATESLNLTTLSGKSVIEEPLVREGDTLKTRAGFHPDFILLNNDCTSGPPALLEGLAQRIEPAYKMGWYNRRKTEHFRVYDQLAREFADTFGIDPWLISAAFHRCGVVNFHEKKGIECVALGVEKVLHRVRQKYEQYGIKEEPYVFIKADSGTYGMGIMTAHSGDDLVEMNKKLRNKMNVIKEGTQNTEVIIQEGIMTIDRVEDKVAEPMIYLMDGIPVGGAYRVNEERDASSNLNAAGMRFAGMCDETECAEEARDRIKVPDCNFSVFGLVAALSALAAAREVYGGPEIGFSI